MQTGARVGAIGVLTPRLVPRTVDRLILGGAHIPALVLLATLVMVLLASISVHGALGLAAGWALGVATFWGRSRRVYLEVRPTELVVANLWKTRRVPLNRTCSVKTHFFRLSKDFRCLKVRCGGGAWVPIHATTTEGQRFEQLERELKELISRSPT